MMSPKASAMPFEVNAVCKRLQLEAVNMGKALPTLGAMEALRLLKAGNAFLDVRSEGEFAAGAIPGSSNGPILTNDERHLVGTTYKQIGSAEAVALGHKLVDPHRPARVAGWAAKLAGQAVPLVACWRGGMRSGLAQSWLAEAGVPAVKISGGYKALRAILLEEIARPRAGLVIAGNTGSGKTKLLRSLKSASVVDLEDMAGHRGSSFGGLFLPEQPSQGTFENRLGLALFSTEEGQRLLLEDESRLVGRCVIPDPFYKSLSALPRFELETPFFERVQNIYEEYVEGPLRSFPPELVHEKLDGSIEALRNRLGGADTNELRAMLKDSFQKKAPHEAWIEFLLRRYYDPLYAYAMARHPHKILARGSASELKSFLARG
ncbi:MAG: tRNA 2-selenouridine(34) synthase MnmH [Proteobacteria bacterium]|nr:MAG: tRNA 2-selenouridine(34) synthase MnmH [Pseudomonadota bacterium]